MTAVLLLVALAFGAWLWLYHPEVLFWLACVVVVMTLSQLAGC